MWTAALQLNHPVRGASISWKPGRVDWSCPVSSVLVRADDTVRVRSSSVIPSHVHRQLPGGIAIRIAMTRVANRAWHSSLHGSLQREHIRWTALFSCGSALCWNKHGDYPLQWSSSGRNSGWGATTFLDWDMHPLDLSSSNRAAQNFGCRELQNLEVLQAWGQRECHGCKHAQLD